MITCPECKGEKQIYSRRFVNRTSGCSYEEGFQPCGTCKGEGQITEQRAALIEEGKRRRADRQSRDLSLREEAKRLGIKPSELNDIELGRQG